VDIESFARVHPIGYVHIAYAVVWGLHFGYAAWIVMQLRRTPKA
jgi:hypothetical protein